MKIEFGRININDILTVFKEQLKISSLSSGKNVWSDGKADWTPIYDYLTNSEIVKYKDLSIFHRNNFSIGSYNERDYRKILQEVKEYWKLNDSFTFDYEFEENWQELEEKDLDNLYDHVDERLQFYKQGLDVRVDIEEAYIYIDLKLFDQDVSVDEALSQHDFIRKTFIQIFKEISGNNVRCYRWNSNSYSFNPNEPFKLIQYERYSEWAVDIIPNGDIQFFFLDGLKNIVYCNGVGGDKGIYLIGKDLVELFKNKYADKFNEKYYNISYRNID